MTNDINVKALLPDTYRRTADHAAAFILKHPEHFPKILELALSDDHQMAMRASRVINLIQESAPGLVNRDLPLILSQLTKTNDTSARRNFLRLFIGNVHLLEENDQVILMDLCFEFIRNAEIEIAPRAYALIILHEFSKKIPEIQMELLSAIKLSYSTFSAALKTRAKNIKNDLNKKAFFE